MNLLMDALNKAEAAPAETRIGDLPHVSMPAGPIRATMDDEGSGGDSGNDEDSGRGDGGRSPPMRADAPAAERRTFDAPAGPRRRGAGRAAGIALSVLAVTAGGAVGGHHVWKTELARPSLVRLPLPVSVAEVAPSWRAGVTASMAGESDAGAVAGPAAQEDEPTTGEMDGAPAGVAGHPPRTAPRARAIVRSEAGTAPAPRPNPGAGAVPRTEPEADAVHRPDQGAGGAARPAPGAGIEIRKRRRPDRGAALLVRAYGTFHAGDLESAAKAYRAVLGHEPRNRDALLGLAAVVARAGRWDEAAAYYARILAFDPADAAAQAALIAIDERDPVRGESRLKALLSSEPRAAYLHFGLGNAYAAQSRWPEAQQAYLDAWRLDRGNADYAYNLAVSLDHLSRPESALDLYREALALAEKRPAGFEAAAVHARIRDLTAP